MNEKLFAIRLAQLRSQKNISARDMSLSLGQNPGYINSIENGKSFPTMQNFFYICEFLKISPRDFFDYQNDNPNKSTALINDIRLLPSNERDALNIIVQALKNNKRIR